MLNKIHTIDDIFHTFKIYKENIIYFSQKGGVISFSIDNLKNNWVALQHSKFHILSIYKSSVFAYKSSEKYSGISQLNIHNGTTINTFDDTYLKFSANEILILTNNNDETICIYDDKKIWTIPSKIDYFPVVINNDFLIGSKHFIQNDVFKIFAIDLKDGHTIWKKELFDIIPNNSRLEKMYGIFDNICYLLISIDDGFYRGHGELLALNVSKGKVIWNTRADISTNSIVVFKDNKYSLFSVYFTASEEEGVIVEFNEVGIPISEVMPKTFYYNEIIEVDLSNGEVIRKEKLNYLYDELKLRFSFCVFDNNLIYFVAQRLENDYEEFLGILDYKTLQLIDYQLVAFEDAGNLQEIQVKDNKIFARDSRGYLYVYEHNFSGGHLTGEKSGSH